MALSSIERKKLLEADLPASSDVRRQIVDYLSRTGLAAADFARRINYSPVSVNSFLNGKYHSIAGNDKPIRAAALDFINTHPVETSEVVDGHIHETENVRLLRRYFMDALNRGRAYYVEGQPGTQKSFVLRHMVASLNRADLSKNGHGRRAYYIYCPANIRRCDFIKLIAESCGSPSIGSVRRVIRNLQFDFRARRVVLCFDEAQHLDIDCLETVRELHDLPPHFGLLFAGSHQFAQMFKTRASELAQWNSRFHAGRALPGISEEEAREITLKELGQVPAKAIDKLIQKSYDKSFGSKGEHTYISARRLFNAIHDLKEDHRDTAEQGLLQ